MSDCAQHLNVDGQAIALDSEGYLVELSNWSPAVAEQLAQQAELPLTDAHWEVITLLREFYQTFEHAPAMRPLVKAVKLQLGEDKGRSIYLMKLFPDSPAKLAAKIAGLPKPTNCI